MIKENNNYTKIGFGAVFAVASVLFSSHAGLLKLINVL